MGEKPVVIKLATFDRFAVDLGGIRGDQPNFTSRDAICAHYGHFRAGIG